MEKFNSKNNRCVVYARYSCSNQTEQSIEGQLHDCEAFAERNGLQIVNKYIDRAMTATTDRRPEFQQMISDSSKGLFDTILVWKLDRFARNRYDSAVYKNKLKANNVKVISCMENITDTPEGVLMESVLEGFAEYFSKDLSQKVKRGMRETAQKHKITGLCPFGYTKSEEGTYIPDKNLVPIIKTIFEMYLMGERQEDIAEYLNNHGCRSILGNKFTKQSITPIIKNTRYTGHYRYADMELYDENQRIISDEVFERVQRRVRSRANAGAMTRAKERYLLSEKLYCGDCHRKMHGVTGTSRNGNKYYYYVCTGRKKYRDCDRKHIQKHIAENYVLNAIEKLLQREDIINRIADTVISRQELLSKNSVILTALSNQLSETNKKINNIMYAIEQGIITPSTQQRLKELEGVKAKLEYEINENKAQNTRFSKPQLIKFFKALNLDENSTWEEKHKIIQHFIDRIYLWEDKMITIYNFTSFSDDNTTDDDYEKEIENITKTLVEPCSTNAVLGSRSWT